ncbi:hypothetical protein AXG93_903s1230 [Marchantia polymorpha subsp. ruderalis]|uniref:Hemerythrin-like domain-containing protein n=2 Tax=Marchantia polymorpha TaxID=3197 RepID=A0A176W146_MARPO|nr:hypothetical protein AXG93_903s1230 [Marchantia polymorpha subsp. ruderalis]
MAQVASSVICMASAQQAASTLGNIKSAKLAPYSSLSGRARRTTVSVSSPALVHSWQGRQIRAKISAERGGEEEEEVTTKEDIILEVKHDHAELEECFQRYKKAHSKGQDHEARNLFNQFVWEISRHSVSEELILYPMMDLLGDRGKELADQSREDHHRTKEILAELQTISDPSLFEKRLNIMMAELRDHMKMEEEEDLAYLEARTDLATRVTAGRTFSSGKKIVPTHPHPEIPDNFVALEVALRLLRNLFTLSPSKGESK